MTDSTIEQFLDSWVVDNKVRGVFFSPRIDISARLLASAFYYKDNVVFGFVHTRAGEVTEIVKKYVVNKNRETLLMFNEETSAPVASISVSSPVIRGLNDNF